MVAVISLSLIYVEEISRLVHCEDDSKTYDLLHAESAYSIIKEQARNVGECSQNCDMVVIRSTIRRYQRSTLTIFGEMGNELDPNLVDIFSERECK